VIRCSFRFNPLLLRRQQQHENGPEPKSRVTYLGIPPLKKKIKKKKKIAAFEPRLSN